MGFARLKVDGATTGATKPEIVSLVEALAGRRAPGIFKVAAKYGNSAGRTPPHRPDLQPAEFVWAMRKVGYGKLCDAVGVRGYVGIFCDCICAADRAKIVEHYDEVAAEMEVGAHALVLDDDLSHWEG